MATILNKRVERRIGNLVVELAEDGLIVRGHRKKKRFKAPWELVVSTVVRHAGVTGPGWTEKQWTDVVKTITKKGR